MKGHRSSPSTPYHGLIPARAGSKGIPGKNIIRLGDQALIRWTARAALTAGVLDDVVLSTDSGEIAAEVADLEVEVPFLRPARLATDSSTSLDVVLHCAEACGWTDDSYVVLLQPTSPFRSARHLREAVTRVRENDLSALVSVTSAPVPYEWHYELTEVGELRGLNDRSADRRQAALTSVVPNGAIYIVRLGVLKEFGTFVPPACVGYLMDEVSSVDLDEPLDLAWAEFLLDRGRVILDG